MRKRAIALALLLSSLLLLACPALATETGFAAFRRDGSYADGLFSDVSPEDWYRDSVAAVYELGLMRGGGEGSFGAADPVRLSETVTLAARLHRLFSAGDMDFRAPAEGEDWFRPYVEYALEQGLLDAEASDYQAETTRRQFAVLFGRALPEWALPEVNAVALGEIPDVKGQSAGAAEIYRLYRAGVLTGSNARGSFLPETPIARSAAAVITARMAFRSLRQKFALQQLTYPELVAMPPAAADFFEGAAMLGNSLVDGMSLYSGLKLDYYGEAGATVFNNRADELLAHAYDKIYLEFGINELSYNPAYFLEEYGKLIDRIHAAQPSAELYLLALTPVTEKRDAEGAFTMQAIAGMNDALRRLAETRRCWYVDCCTPLLNEAGFLPEEYGGWDGSPHLSRAGYMAWAGVIRTYYH